MDLAIMIFGVTLVVCGVLAILAWWVFPSWSQSRLFGRWFDWQPEPTRARETAFAIWLMVLGTYLFASAAELRVLARASVVAVFLALPALLVTQYRSRR